MTKVGYLALPILVHQNVEGLEIQMDALQSFEGSKTTSSVLSVVACHYYLGRYRKAVNVANEELKRLEGKDRVGVLLFRAAAKAAVCGEIFFLI